jgi:hypothetical protein
MSEDAYSNSQSSSDGLDAESAPLEGLYTSSRSSSYGPKVRPALSGDAYTSSPLSYGLKLDMVFNQELLLT